MQNIFLLRHGKAVNTDIGTKDYNRKLNKKGNAQINQVGYMLNDYALELDLIISSKARRTFETAQIINHYLQLENVHFSESLYLCDHSVISDSLSKLKANNILYVGHNNGVSDFLNWISDENILMSTGMLVHIELDIPNFSYISRGIGEIKMKFEPNILTF